MCEARQGQDGISESHYFQSQARVCVSSEEACGRVSGFNKPFVLLGSCENVE